MMGIEEEIPELPHSIQQEGGCMEARGRSSPRTEFADTLILDFSDSRAVKNNVCC